MSERGTTYQLRRRAHILFLYCYPEYESNLRINHSLIVDLGQVFETIPTIDVWAI